MSTPPGIPIVNSGGKGFVLEEGGEVDTWQPIQQDDVRRYTNAFIVDDEQQRILLGLKKRGFGVNKYNGFGGKVDADETPLAAAKRELEEEAGIKAPLEHCGILVFKAADHALVHYVDVYRAGSFEGTVTESEEMRPKWFTTALRDGESTLDAFDTLPPIPYDTMWADDRFWLPWIVSGQKFVGRVDFGSGTDVGETKMTKWWFLGLDNDVTLS